MGNNSYGSRLRWRDAVALLYKQEASSDCCGSVLVSICFSVIILICPLSYSRHLALPSDMDRVTISFPETSFVTSGSYTVSGHEREVEGHIKTLCEKWTLEGLKTFEGYYSEEVQSKLDWELSGLVKSEYGGKSSTPSESAIKRRPRRADYWATPRRAEVLLLHGTHLRGGPLLRKDIELEWREYFESWSTKLTKGLGQTGDELPENLDWTKLWNACLATRISPVCLFDSAFKSFCSLLKQVGSIGTPETVPEDTLSSMDPNDGDGPQGKTDKGPKPENKD